MAVHDLYREFSADVAARLERGENPWAPAASGRPVRYTGQPYGGVSVLAQWSAARERGHSSPVWLSRPVIETLGGRVPEGAAPVFAWYGGRRLVSSPSPATGDIESRVARVWRRCAVWNAEAVEGLSEQFSGAAGRDAAGEPEAHLGALVEAAGIPADCVTGAGQRHAPDDEERYWDRETGSRRWGGVREMVEEGDGWYDLAMTGDGVVVESGGRATWYEHEHPLVSCRRLLRWSGEPAQLNRRGEDAEETLTVEIGAALLAADLRLPPSAPVPAGGDVEVWCRLLRSDDLAIFRCARDATRAAEHVQALVPGYRVDTAPYLVLPARNAAPALRAAVSGPAAGESARPAPAREARQFVAAVEAWRKTGEAGQAVRLLDASGRIDLDAQGVADAVVAAAFLHGVSAGTAADYMAAFREEAQGVQQARNTLEVDPAPQIRFPDARM
ncbi:MAG: ArdC-like ssDNA-binding domain-containing protein [bacterium]|nr:ArdC-like ssDNA-binding domain-containing protein [bacterium]